MQAANELLPWEAKANRLIAEFSRSAWYKANHKSNGDRYKKHRPYSPPEEAQELVRIMGLKNRKIAECEAKNLFLCLADGWKNFL